MEKKKRIFTPVTSVGNELARQCQHHHHTCFASRATVVVT